MPWNLIGKAVLGWFCGDQDIPDNSLAVETQQSDSKLNE
jgi:hypothetical protein